MNKTLHNRIKQAETAAAFRGNRQRGPSGMGAVYDLINNPDRIRTPVFRRLLSEMTTAELLEQCGHLVDKEFDLSQVPMNVLLKIKDSRNPDKMLADWIGSQQ